MRRWSCWQGATGSADPLDYALRAEELRRYGYPDQEANDYRQAPASSEAPRIFGLDCEMVLTADGPSLARVSLVEHLAAGHENERFALVYDAFVAPASPVLDYVSEHSGIKAHHLEEVTRSRAQALDELCALLRESDLLCGHDLSHDLRALRLSHRRIIDTQILYPHHDGPPHKRSLKSLCLEHLKRQIQLDAHSSIEDAAAALELAMLRVESRPIIFFSKISHFLQSENCLLHSR